MHDTIKLILRRLQNNARQGKGLSLDWIELNQFEKFLREKGIIGRTE